MATFIIERHIPEIEKKDQESLKDAASHSKNIIQQMNKEGKAICWEHSYITDNRIFCLYSADSESLILEHAERSGFPATEIILVHKKIGPKADK